MGDLKASPQPEFSWKDDSKTAPGAGYLKAALILPTGMVARADLIFQESCDLMTGATRALPATSSIQGGNIFTNGSGNYLKSAALAGLGTITVVKLEGNFTRSVSTVTDSGLANNGVKV